MFKKIVSVFLQMLLFLVAFGAGSFLPVFHVLPAWTVNVNPTRVFVLDGLFLMLALFVVILLIEAAMKRIRASAGLTALALVLALALGFAMKFGFVERSAGF
ncbi:hypothetical protein ACFQBQ_08270 [Granulicella cerasi]|uniref:Uncharacterized protein n=1 Tax=Granulicella cerasi TaxID=741063 RepID=A0ABW1Z8P6_9BACT|nr:hypothetical protein [Granulicella cerasi]